MIFLIRRGRQAIHAVRVRQRFILAGERRGGDRAIIKPELTPPFFTGNGGNCDICLSIISAMRRSDSAPISAIASARLSAAMATGSAWKLPPEITSPHRQRPADYRTPRWPQPAVPLSSDVTGSDKRPLPAAGSEGNTGPELYDSGDVIQQWRWYRSADAGTTARRQFAPVVRARHECAHQRTARSQHGFGSQRAADDGGGK